MEKLKKFTFIIIIFVILSYILLGLFNSNSYALSQEYSTDIDGIDDNLYPGIKQMIKDLQSKHPNWQFKLFYTDLDWSDVIANEYIGHGVNESPRNLVPINSYYVGEWVCPICNGRPSDSGSWTCASEIAIKYMMDPRNSLNESDIFQFEEITNNGYNWQTVMNMLSGTFLDHWFYADVISYAGSENNVSPYYLVARILQEQGKNGSTLSKGEGYNGQYVGYYNVFNIGASGSSREQVILNGLKRAEQEGWDSLEKSIKGGIKFITEKYIARGQNTLYFQKFDVNNEYDGMYWHQYMQNIMAAQSEGTELRETYEKINSVDSQHTFIIPLYRNMPEKISKKPNTSDDAPSITSDLVRVNVNSTLRLRDSPNGNYIGIYLNKDEIVTRIEKAETKVGGTYWDKVLRANGETGYAARQTFDDEEYKLYLVPVEESGTGGDNNNGGNENPGDDNPGENNPGDNPDNPGEEIPEEPVTPPTEGEINIVDTDRVRVEKESSIIKVAADVNVDELKQTLGEYANITDGDGNSASVLGTGCKVNGQYVVVKMGDVNGNGELTAADYLYIKDHMMGDDIITDQYKLLAADVNQKNGITAADYLYIKDNIMNGEKITLNLE